MILPRIVDRQEWADARRQLLVKEKQATHALDALAAERRRLPMVEVGAYEFQSTYGSVTLLDLFSASDQLLVYQFMDTGPDEFCPGCTAFTDNTDVVHGRSNLRGRRTTFVTVSDLPLDRMQTYWGSRGWTVPFVSSRGTSFSADTGPGVGFGLSAYVRDGDRVFQTYFTDGRGVDRLRFDLNMLDLTALGRQEAWEEPPDAAQSSVPVFSVGDADTSHE